LNSNVTAKPARSAVHRHVNKHAMPLYLKSSNIDTTSP
jgi:hypothetical protein